MTFTNKLGAALLALALITPTWAAGKKKAAASAATPAKSTAATPTANPAMEQAMKFGAPTENHDVFKPLVGTFYAQVRMWMDPNAQPQESKGVSQNSLVYGGRFLKQEYKGSMGDTPFEGTGYYGYDNVRQVYQSLWMDSFMTGIMEGAGSYDAATKTLKSGGTFGCPMTGNKDQYFRSEWQIIDNNTNVYSSYSKGPDGNEFKGMEIVFKRIV